MLRPFFHMLSVLNKFTHICFMFFSFWVVGIESSSSKYLSNIAGSCHPWTIVEHFKKLLVWKRPLPMSSADAVANLWHRCCVLTWRTWIGSAQICTYRSGRMISPETTPPEMMLHGITIISRSNKKSMSLLIAPLMALRLLSKVSSHKPDHHYQGVELQWSSFCTFLGDSAMLVYKTV